MKYKRLLSLTMSAALLFGSVVALEIQTTVEFNNVGGFAFRLGCGAA